MRRALPILIVAAALAACGAGDEDARPAPGALADGSVPAVPVPVRIGRGPGLRPGPGPGPPAGVPCGAPRPPRGAAHLELFAAGQTVIVPAGIGVAPPRRRTGAFVTGGRCAASGMRTSEPTGLIELTAASTPTLGDLFALWGRPLDGTRLLGHRGRVRAWVDGEPWRGSVRAIPLARHAQIVVVVGPDVPVHATYAFPPDATTHLRP